MKSASFRNLVLLIVVMLWIASAKTVRNISLVRKVRLEDVCRVGFDAVEEVIVGWVEQFRRTETLTHSSKRQDVIIVARASRARLAKHVASWTTYTLSTDINWHSSTQLLLTGIYLNDDVRDQR